MKLNGMFILQGAAYFLMLFAFKNFEYYDDDPSPGWHYIVTFSAVVANYSMLQLVYFLWGIAQLVPFMLGMRLHLVTRHTLSYSFTKDLSAFNKRWWSVVVPYIAVIFICCMTNLCINPGGSETT